MITLKMAGGVCIAVTRYTSTASSNTALTVCKTYMYYELVDIHVHMYVCAYMYICYKCICYIYISVQLHNIYIM